MDYNYGNLPVKRTSKPVFTYEQEVCLQLMALPKRGGHTLAQIAEQAGVSEKTLRRWRSSETFQRQLQRMILMSVNEDLNDIMSVMVEKAKSGNNKSAELVLKSLGVLQERHIITPEQPDRDFDNSSNECIAEEIEELKRLLGEI